MSLDAGKDKLSGDRVKQASGSMFNLKIKKTLLCFYSIPLSPELENKRNYFNR